MIEISDMLYGKMVFPKVIAELLSSAALQRLKNIHQSGAVVLVNPAIRHTRFEHSVGVMMLIRLLGGSEKEQVAGLLHDLSHTAFSHVGDYVLGEAAENYHEQIFEEVLMASDIPDMLQQHGYAAQDFINEDFSMLEQPLPYLCADRLDYTLRDSVYAGLLSAAEARHYLQFIEVRDGQIVMGDEEQGLRLNQLYERLDREFFRFPLYQYAHERLTALLKRLLDEGELDKKDLMRNDRALLNKVRTCKGGLEELRAITARKGLDVYLKRKEGGLQFKRRFLRAM